jgi:hypothetical protein
LRATSRHAESKFRSWNGAPLRGPIDSRNHNVCLFATKLLPAGLATAPTGRPGRWPPRGSFGRSSIIVTDELRKPRSRSCAKLNSGRHPDQCQPSVVVVAGFAGPRLAFSLRLELASNRLPKVAQEICGAQQPCRYGRVLLRQERSKTGGTRWPRTSPTIGAFVRTYIAEWLQPAPVRRTANRGWLLHRAVRARPN